MNKLIRSEKKSKKDNEISNVSSDSSAKSLWNMVKNRTCWSSPSSPTILKTGENEFTSSPLKMASALNGYFVSKVEKICESLSDSKQDPTYTLKKVIRKWGKMGSVPKFTFKKVDPATVRKIILGLKNSNAECREGISNNIVKMCVDILTYPMTHLINQIFEKADFPRIWKL